MKYSKFLSYTLVTTIQTQHLHEYNHLFDIYNNNNISTCLTCGYSFKTLCQISMNSNYSRSQYVIYSIAFAATAY